ncbi:MAG TPA: ABC transporter ATP-binding protein [Devosiaceae bacterium]|nr:ABC transporter ATP-binding protein [Devosiaceae bacterium]
MAEPPPDAAVSLEGVSKSYDGRPVIENLDLAVAPGEFLALLGPSGSGKTTIMRIIGGFEAPDGGRVRIAGRDVTEVPPERRDVSTVFQSYALFPHLNVLDNVAFGPRMRGVGRAERERRARQLLELVHLEEVPQRMPAELSGGMQQRVALARALANDPAVLLLDEPLGALDRKLREELQRELRRVQHAIGATFIYVTHDQDEAFGMADRLAVMREGRIEQVGDPASIYDRPANGWVALFVGSGNSFAATVGGPGARSVIATDFGPLRTEHVDPNLRGGERALVVVRPEATRIEPLTAEGGPTVNRIPARLVDIVAVGPSARLRAVTAPGREFEAVMRRADAPPLAFSPGDEVVIAFDAAATRVYRPDPQTPAI